MEILLLIFYFSLVVLTIALFIQDRKIERMKRVMEQERPIFVALKVQEGIKKALSKAKTDVEFFKMMERGFKN